MEQFYFEKHSPALQPEVSIPRPASVIVQEQKKLRSDAGSNELETNAIRKTDIGTHPTKLICKSPFVSYFSFSPSRPRVDQVQQAAKSKSLMGTTAKLVQKLGTDTKITSHLETERILTESRLLRLNPKKETLKRPSELNMYYREVTRWLIMALSLFRRCSISLIEKARNLSQGCHQWTGYATTL